MVVFIYKEKNYAFDAPLEPLEDIPTAFRDHLKLLGVFCTNRLLVEVLNENINEWNVIKCATLYPLTFLGNTYRVSDLEDFVVHCSFGEHKFQLYDCTTFHLFKGEFVKELGKLGYGMVSDIFFEIYNEEIEDWIVLTNERQLKSKIKVRGTDARKSNCEKRTIGTQTDECTLQAKPKENDEQNHVLSKNSVEEWKNQNMNQINQEDIEAKENEKSDLKCLHYRDNPLQWKIIRYQEEFKRLTEENKKLLVRIDLLKQGNDDVTRIVDDEMSKSEMVQSLQAELLLTKKKQQTIMEAYKKASKDLRRIVYLLTGYRFDAFKNGVYKLTHMLTSGQNCFMFTMDEEEVVNMLETPFSVQFQDLMTQYLLQYDSFPAFLSAVTIRLLEQKQIADVSTA